ncbi:MAG: hypothetical protein RLZZ42_1252, partial [Bacteroidota bacterium]
AIEILNLVIDAPDGELFDFGEIFLHFRVIACIHIEWNLHVVRTICRNCNVQAVGHLQRNRENTGF